jgi:hypothetical protein
MTCDPTRTSSPGQAATSTTTGEARTHGGVAWSEGDGGFGADKEETTPTGVNPSSVTGLHPHTPVLR